MRVTFPIALSETLTGTLRISISVGKETAAQAMRQGTDAEELQNLAEQKLQEIIQQVGDVLGLSAD